MFYKILSIGLFFSLCPTAPAQGSFLIKGLVLLVKDLTPAQGATMVGKDHFSVTSETGAFTINNVAEGTYSFTISHIGCKSKTLGVDVDSNLGKIKVFQHAVATVLEEVKVSGKTKKREAMEAPIVSHTVSED
ncbi:hypothetical protein [Zobellia uliginosa]|uniref:hypothetical protein n=1 Tax=Zobellia uliginosa TaxID=143224 RepID=UPI0026E3AA60|nr:hypothetical protein [Zobellia uliginosa]MDO6519390.1 hypothetical protein [Zobellia uliginosa]